MCSYIITKVGDLMKLKYVLVILALAVQIVGCGSNEADKGSEVYAYPILPGTDEWKELNSHQEMIEVCQIPYNILKELDDYELIVSILEYPLFDDIYLYDNLEEGFKTMANSFNGFEELSSRPDIEATANKIYEDIKNQKELSINVNSKTMASRLEIIDKYFFDDFDLISK